MQNPHSLGETLKMTLCSAIENTCATTLVKISVSIFVLRMIQRTHRPIQYIIYAQLGVLVPFTIATVAVLAAQCRPLAGYWDHSVKAKCLPAKTVTIMTKVNNGESDWSSLPRLLTKHSDLRNDRLPHCISLYLCGCEVADESPQKICIVRCAWSWPFVWGDVARFKFKANRCSTAGCSIAKTVYLSWNPPDPTCKYKDSVLTFAAIRSNIFLCRGFSTSRILVRVRPLRIRSGSFTKNFTKPRTHAWNHHSIIATLGAVYFPSPRGSQYK